MRGKKRLVALLMAGAMVCSALPVNALAVEISNQNTGGLCEHHTEHNESCGYTAGTEGTPCVHEHNEDCYTLVTKCIHRHRPDCYPAEAGLGSTASLSDAEAWEPTECIHQCSEESGCIIKRLDCRHEHTEACGYTEAGQGTPCTFVCEICNPQNSKEPVEPECICEHRCTADAVNTGCPVCGAEGGDLTACKGARQEILPRVLSWSFVENPDGAALTEESGKPAVLLGQELPSFEQLSELLPRQLCIEVKETGEETLSAQSVTIGISGWSCPAYPAGLILEEDELAEVFNEEYIFVPQMEEEYAFDETPELLVGFSRISLLGNPADRITIQGDCVFANGIPIVIKENGTITSVYSENGDLLSGDTDVSEMFIFGGWSDSGTHTGNTSVTMESGKITKNIYGGNQDGTLEGSTQVEIEGGKVGWVYGGGKNSTVNGTAKVIIHPGSKIWGSDVGNESANERGTVFGGGNGGSVRKTEVTLLGGDFGWAYGGGYNCAVTTTDIKLTANPDNWCNVYGGGNLGSVETANLTVRGVDSPYTVFLYGGGWCDEVETANITIGGDCRLSGNISIYATGSGDPWSSNTSTVKNANFVIDEFNLISTGNTTVCGPLVGTNVTGETNVLVTGSKSPDASMQLFLKDIEKVKLEECSAVLLGADPDPSQSGNPQPLALECLEVAGSGEAVFTSNNATVTIKELAGSGTLIFEGYSKEPATITGVSTVSSTAAAPLQIVGRGTSMVITDTVFIKGSGITSVNGFASGMPAYTAVKSEEGIQMKLSTEVKKPAQITLATFDKDSYSYGEEIKVSIEAKTDTGAPLAGETVYIQDWQNGTPLVSVVLDEQGKANVSLTVNSFVWNILTNGGKKLIAIYRGSEQYQHYNKILTAAGTASEEIVLTDANIVLTQEIPAPELNKEPVRTLDAGDTFFTAEIAWSPDSTVFQADTPYTASILLKPKDTFTLEHIGSVTYRETSITGQLQPDGSLLLPAVRQFAAIISEKPIYDTEKNSLTRVPEPLAAKFSTIEALKDSLYQKTLETMGDIPESNMAYYEVQLMVSMDNGTSWEEAIPGNFPSEGVEITLPYPDGTKADTHDFVVAHMFTRSANGQMPGFIEIPAIQETSAGIIFRLNSLSPISIGWKQVVQEPETPDEPSSDDSSSSDRNDSSGSPAVTQRPEPDKPNAPTTVQSKPVKTDEMGNVTITRPVVSDAVEAAKADANKYGNMKNGIGIAVPVETGKILDGVQITLKADVLDTLEAEQVKRFSIDTGCMTDFDFPLDTLKELNRQTSGDIILKMKKAADFSGEAKTAIGTRPAYDISLWEVKNGKETRLTSLNGTSISIAIFYTPAENEQTGNLYAVYADGNGKVQWILKSSYDADQKAVIAAMTQPGIYGVGCNTQVSAITGIEGHWAKENLLFASSRGLITGAGSPDAGMTRGMFVTALGRLSGIAPTDVQAVTFQDVKADSYYAPYVSWAVSEEIVKGVSAVAFAPDTCISREQMAVIMKNYADKMGYALPRTLKAVTFADNATISSGAQGAVRAMQQAGILVGKENNQFDPRGIATCAEAAAVLRRFVEIVTDPQTANGWTQNDSGKWSYYQNGEMVRGWLSNDQRWYWLDPVTGTMFSGGWKEIDGKQYYFYPDGSMAFSTKVDGYEVGADGARN